MTMHTWRLGPACEACPGSRTLPASGEVPHCRLLAGCSCPQVVLQPEHPILDAFKRFFEDESVPKVLRGALLGCLRH